MHEEQRERLRVLADSINETARMARATNSLFLFVALYLALTLLSTTDENLLRNGQVVLPQVGAGISIVQSYVLAPVVFLYLHGQALVLLTVFARKVHTFETVLRDEFPDTVFDVQAKRKECRDWLSAFALVQVFQGDSGPSTMSSHCARSAEALRVRVGLQIAVDAGAAVGLVRHDKALLFQQLLHRLVVRKMCDPRRFPLRHGGALRNDVALRHGRQTFLLAVGVQPDVAVVGHAVHGIVVEALPAILSADIEACPDGPSALSDEPDQAGRHGVDRQLYPPVCKGAVKPLS